MKNPLIKDKINKGNYTIGVGMSKIKNPLQSYINKWVALDDKDRLVSFARNRKEMLEDIEIYNNYIDNFKVRVYKLFDKDELNIIKGMLN